MLNKHKKEAGHRRQKRRLTSSAVENATESKIAKNSLLAYCRATCAKDDNGDQEKSGRSDRDKSMDVDNESLVESDEEKEIGSIRKKKRMKLSQRTKKAM